MKKPARKIKPRLPKVTPYKVNWLDNGMRLIPSFALVFNEDEYFAVFRDINSKYRHPYEFNKPENASGWVRYLRNSNDDVICLVCLCEDFMKYTLAELCGLMAHEAVHIFQELCAVRGEKEPSKEFQAYTIQHITQQLIQELFSRKFSALAVSKQLNRV